MFQAVICFEKPLSICAVQPSNISFFVATFELKAAIRDTGIRVNCICPGRTDTEMDFPRHGLTKQEIEARDSLPKQP